MDKLQCAKDLLADINFAVKSGEGEIPVDNNDTSVVKWLIEQTEKVEQLEKDYKSLTFVLGKSDTKLIKIRQILDGFDS
jgi:hypothetical protein